jgi:erythritol transport system ATP-binding protein
MNPDVILSTVDITKVYPGTVALNKVNIKIYRGKVNVIVGENGAGKSTLMKIFAGSEQPTDGKIFLENQEIHLSSPLDAAKHGIGIVYQELSLFPNMTISDNIFIGNEEDRGILGINYKNQDRISHDLIMRMEQNLDPHTLVGELRLAQQQCIEIAKALGHDVRVLIMDEPTSALSETEVIVLFRIIEELKNAGVTIIYISHKLDELQRIAENIVILRDGQLIAEAESKSINTSWIIEKMVGRKPEALYIKEPTKSQDTILEVKDLTLHHPYIAGRNVLTDVSFSIKAGEILGFYGLMGAGRTELLECLIGRYRVAQGEIILSGESISNQTIAERINRGLILIPEDRQRDGFVKTMSVSANMTLASLNKFTKMGYISSKDERSSVLQMIEDFSIKVTDPDQSITSLSGGNQQKVIVSKTLLTSPRVLLMDEPTRGIDVGAKGEIFQIMNRLASRNFGIIFVSSELTEVLTMSDRIIVMSKGHITATLDHSEATEEKLVYFSAPKNGKSEKG